MLPVIEQLAQAIALRVAGCVTTAGYNVNVLRVVRPNKKNGGGFTPEDYLVVQTQDDPKPNEELSAPGNPRAKAWDVDFSLHLFSMPSDADATPFDSLLNIFRADVEKCLCAPANWHQWDGLAINTTIGPPQSFEPEDNSFQGVAITLTITFRTAENDPYTVR